MQDPVVQLGKQTPGRGAVLIGCNSDAEAVRSKQNV
jgi:hypothetical protein